MLNASYNLPSEDCNTEKQMVFHSNKLLCVYSLQSWLSDTFTFGSELPCCWQPGGRRHSVSEKGLPVPGGIPSQAPRHPPGGFGCSSESDHRRVLCLSLSQYLQFRPGAGSQLPLEAAPPRSRWWLRDKARSLAECDSPKPRALQASQPSRTVREMQRRQDAVFCGGPTGERLRAGALEPGGSRAGPDLSDLGWPGDLGGDPPPRHHPHVSFLICHV